MKTRLVANKDFKSKDGKDHKAGDRLELDDSEAQEIIRRGDAKQDQAQQQPAEGQKK